MYTGWFRVPWNSMSFHVISCNFNWSKLSWDWVIKLIQTLINSIETFETWKSLYNKYNDNHLKNKIKFNFLFNFLSNI